MCCHHVPAGTDAVLVHPPHILALGCAQVAGQLEHVSLGTLVEPTATEQAEIKRVANSLLALYESSSRLEPRTLSALHERLREHWLAHRPLPMAATAPD